MIEFTIKTLDSDDHQFSVNDEITVGELKEQIRQQMNIAINMQRLIFCGRVLTDEQKLADHNVHGKVIHLVPRPPPSPSSRNTARREARATNSEGQRFYNRMVDQRNSGQRATAFTLLRNNLTVDTPSDLVLDQHHSLSITPTANRLDFIRRTIDDIYQSLSNLFTLVRNHYDDSNPGFTNAPGYSGESARPPAEEAMDVDMVPTSNTTDSTTEKTPQRKPGSRNFAETSRQHRRRRGGPFNPPTARRVAMSRPRDLANLLDELDDLQQDFAPYRHYYLNILRDTSTSELSDFDRANRQNVVEVVSNVMHSFAHAYHAASDIYVTIGERYPRLESGVAVDRPSMHAQINVVHTARRPESFGGANARSAAGPARSDAGPSRSDAGPARSDAAPARSEAAPARSDAAPARSDAATTRSDAATTNPTNPTPPRAQPQTPSQRSDLPSSTNGTNANQAGTPVPVTYQVEIETRVPIAFPIDSAIINGLAAVASNIQQGQNGPGQAQPQNQAQDQEGQPRVLSEIENLMRALSEVHPGMEVVMSMEQVSSIDPTGRRRTNIEPNESTRQVASPSDEMLFAQMMDDTPNNAGNRSAATSRASAGEATGATARPTGKPGDEKGISVYDQLIYGGASGTTSSATAAATTSTAASSSGPSSNPNANRCRGHGRGTGNPFPPNATPTFGTQPGFPGYSATFSVGEPASSTLPSGTLSIGPSAISVQPDGVIITPMSGEAYEFQNMLLSMFRQNISATTGSATTGSATTTTSTATTGSATTGTATTGSATTGSAPTGSAPTRSATSSSATTGSAAIGSGTTLPTNVIGPTQAGIYTNPRSATVTVNSIGISSRSNVTNMPESVLRRINNMLDGPTRLTYNANAAGRTSDSTWGFGNNVVTSDNASSSQQDRPGPLSVMARARSLQQQAEQRRRQQEYNTRHGISAADVLRQENDRQRGNNSRAHRLAMACLVYDRYLPCDSVHAAERLNQRGSDYQMSYVEQMRTRTRRRPVPEIENLQERNILFTSRHMATMMRLLSGSVCIEGQANAFFVAVARALYLEPQRPVRRANDEPNLMPSEFLFIRAQLRAYIQTLIPNFIYPSRYSCDIVASRMLESVSTFLETIPTITMIHPVNELEDMLYDFLRRRMPVIVACVMVENSSDHLATRFYGVFGRFFNDFCGTIISMCVRGWNGLCAIFRSFINQLTEQYEPPVREWIRVVARENLMMIRRNIDPQSPVDFYSRYRFEESLSYLARNIISGGTPPQNDRNDTPDTEESPPSMSMPTFSSGSSETSGSPLPTDDPENDASEGSPPLEEDDNEPSSGADVASSSCNSRQRSPVETSSSGTTPKQETTDQKTTDQKTTDQKTTDQKTTDQKTTQESESAGNEENKQAETSAQSPAHERSQTSSSRSSPDSMRFAPPEVIVEHWGEEWVPVFTRDQRAQRDRPQEPHSDAYLSGMPSRKRRCVRASRPPTTLDGFMTESVREAMDNAASIDPAQLRSVIRDQVRSIVRTRADASEDYDPVRYSSTARFLDQTKQKKKESDTKTEKD